MFTVPDWDIKTLIIGLYLTVKMSKQESFQLLEVFQRTVQVMA